MTDKTHIQGGAKVKRRGAPKFTKTLLKERIKSEPDQVELFATSGMGPQFHGTADNLPENTEFLVVGPNPYSQRDWYAKIHKGRGGSLVVK